MKRRSVLPPLCAIVDVDAAAKAGWSAADLATAFLAGGAQFLQLRAKGLASGPLLELASGLVELAGASGAIVVVNDRADVARLSGAAGVHVGQDDLPPADVRRILGSDALVGYSTHTIEQIEGAIVEPVDYVAIGPVFGTTSKETGYDAVGLDLVREAAVRVHPRGLRLVAIGGITLERAAEVIDAGADVVAVIGDLLATGDPEARAREYASRLTR